MNNNIPLIEKYKPKKLSDLILDDRINNILLKIINKKELDKNLIFVGNVGTSKTATLECLINELYNTKKLKNYVISFNSYDDRGIKINEPIISFCKKKFHSEEGEIKQRLLVFDETDSISQKTQKLICSNMEKFKDSKYIFTCNDINNIIEAIKSRCIILHFNNNDKFIDKLKYICDNEKINNYDYDALKYLYLISNKDYRKSINMLDLLICFKKYINIENINVIFGIPETKVFNELLNGILDNNINKIVSIIIKFKNDGLYSFDTLMYFIQYITINNDIDEEIKINLVDILSTKAFDMNKSIINYIQFTNAILSCIK